MRRINPLVRDTAIVISQTLQPGLFHPWRPVALPSGEIQFQRKTPVHTYRITVDVRPVLLNRGKTL